MSRQPYPLLSVDSKATKVKFQSGKDVEEGEDKEGRHTQQVKCPMATTQDAIRYMQHGEPWLGFVLLFRVWPLCHLSSSLALHVCMLLLVCLSSEPRRWCFFAPFWKMLNATMVEYKRTIIVVNQAMRQLNTHTRLCLLVSTPFHACTTPENKLTVTPVCTIINNGAANNKPIIAFCLPPGNGAYSSLSPWLLTLCKVVGNRYAMFVMQGYSSLNNDIKGQV